MKLVLHLLFMGMFCASAFASPDFKLGNRKYSACDLGHEQKYLNWKDLLYVCYHFKGAYTNAFFKRKNQMSFKRCFTKNCYPYVNDMEDYHGFSEDQHASLWKVVNPFLDVDVVSCFAQRGLYKTHEEMMQEYDRQEECTHNEAEKKYANRLDFFS